jgi:hypothetical protein
MKDLSKVVDAGPAPLDGSRWTHRNGGTYEVVVGLARIEATLEAAVVYRSLERGIVWVRPLAEFIDGRFSNIET